MKQKAITVRAEDERHLHQLGIIESLLHASADGVIVVLGFDHGNRNIGFVEQHIISPLVLRAYASDHVQ